MPREPLVLIFDCGTQSTRGFLFTKNGEIKAKSKIEHIPYHPGKIGYAEKPAEEYWEAVCMASQELKRTSGELWNDIIAMSVTTLRSVYTFLDKDCKPLRPCITWLDKRMARCKKKFGIVRRFLFNLVGMTRAVYKQRKMSPGSWMKENEPDLWAKTDKICIISGYINKLLSGRLVDGVANQASRLPMDYKNCRWMKPNSLKFPVFNVEYEKLCNLIMPGEVIGYVSAEAAVMTGIAKGMTIIASGSDKACETLGVGCLDNDIASISFGTASSIQLMTTKYVEPEQFMPAYNSVVPGYFNPEIQIFRGYWMVTWFKNEFAGNEVERAMEMGLNPEQVLDMFLDQVPPGSDGLLLQPYWAPGLKQPEAKGSILGFCDAHTRAHIYRAIIEGIDYALLEGLKGMEKKSKLKIKRLSVSGGGSNSDTVCQLTADLFGLPVYRVQTSETSGLGGAIVTFTAMKEFENVQDAVKHMVHFKDEFLPNAEVHTIYERLFNNVYKLMYPSLKKMYLNLYKIVDSDEDLYVED